MLPQSKKTTFLWDKDQSILFSILMCINSTLGRRILTLSTTAYLAQNIKFLNIKLAPQKAMRNLFISTHTKYSWEIFLEMYVTVPIKQSGNSIQFHIPPVKVHGPTEVPLFFRFSSPPPSSASSESPSLSSAGSSGSRGGSYRAVLSGKYRSSSGEYLRLQRLPSFFLNSTYVKTTFKPSNLLYASRIYFTQVGGENFILVIRWG